MDRFKVVSEPDILLDRLSIEVSCRCFVQWPTFLWNIDGDDLLSFDVVDGAEVQGICVLQVVNVGSVVHECLLESRAVGESLVISVKKGESMPAFKDFNENVC